ncbi:MAG: 50S ribosomal protein L27 [bacterium]|nr:50S ribosomal protein L27 [bacterium]MDZ4285263.1 50S ribosomal protein L27 [Patescibacteria group bacterium]
MAHRKAGGSAKNLRDSQPKYLGIKLSAGERARRGAVIVRQRGTRILAGENVGIGHDHTLFALADGHVEFRDKRHKRFDGRTISKKIAHVV